MEARGFVFIGCALAYADVEVRQLLAKCSPDGTEVDVVLFSQQQLGERAYADAVWRFEEFFGQGRIHVFSCGAAHYVQQCTWRPL